MNNEIEREKIFKEVIKIIERKYGLKELKQLSKKDMLEKLCDYQLTIDFSTYFFNISKDELNSKCDKKLEKMYKDYCGEKIIKMYKDKSDKNE